MSLNDYINFDEIAENSSIDSNLFELGYIVINKDCDLMQGDDGLEINLVMGKDNGYQTNDPAYDSTELLFILDKNLDVIEEKIL